MKTFIITGTTSGLGKAFFDILSKKDVCIVSISRRFLPDQQELSGKNNISLVKTDLSDPASVAGMDLQKLVNTKDVVFINNAATIKPIGPIGQLDPQQMIESINVNLTAPALIVNLLLKMKLNLTLINISTGASSRVIEGWGVYCSTKAGASMLFNVVKQQNKDSTKVIVNSIDPGVMDTPMQKTIRETNFPQNRHFVKLKDDHTLGDPRAVAEQILKDIG